MKVRVSVRGRFHAFDLARELAALGVLERLVTSYPRAHTARFGIPSDQILSLPRHEVLARAVRRLPRTSAQRLEARVAASWGRAAARRNSAELDLLVAFSGQALEQIAPARRIGAKVVLERGSAHIETQRELLEAAAADAGVAVRLPHPSIIERELAEYDAADAISVPSPFAAHSFLARGYPAEKLMVNPYGVDLEHFAPTEVPTREPNPTRRLRVLSVGRVSVQKGAHLLVAAFEQAELDGELHFVGPIEPELARFARAAASERIHFHGSVPQQALAQHYRRADCFALASYQEGLAMVILQAMASGLPVLASANSGAAGLFSERDGLLLAPSGDTGALAAGLERLAAMEPDERRAFGARAAARARSGFSWSDYGARAVAAYRRLLGGEALTDPKAAWPSREHPLVLRG